MATPPNKFQQKSISCTNSKVTIGKDLSHRNIAIDFNIHPSHDEKAMDGTLLLSPTDAEELMLHLMEVIANIRISTSRPSQSCFEFALAQLRAAIANLKNVDSNGVKFGEENDLYQLIFHYLKNEWERISKQKFSLLELDFMD